MPGQRVLIGPWNGGMHRVSDPSESAVIGDNQLSSTLNLNFDNKGFLNARHGCYRTTYADFTTYGAGGIRLLGSVVYNNTLVAVVAVFDNTNTRFYYYSNYPNSWNPVTVGGVTYTRAGWYQKVVQYNNLIWFVPGSSGGASGFNLTTLVGGTVTNVATIPSIVIVTDAFMFQDRMFVVDGTNNTVYWSKATDPTVWASPDGGFFKVNPGDGDEIRRVVVNGSVMQIFKRRSSFMFTFNTDPGVNGYLRPISTEMGGVDAIVHANSTYVVNGRGIFRLSNAQFLDISQDLNYLYWHPDIAQNDVYFNIIGKYLLIGAYTDTVYSYNTETGVWSRHTYETNMGPRVRGIIHKGSNGSVTIFANAGGNMSYIAHDKTNETYDQTTTGTYVSPEAEFTTKNFEYGDIDNWKRLFWWDVKGSVQLDSQDAMPVVIVNDTYSNNFIDNLTLRRVLRKMGPSLRFQRVKTQWWKPRQVLGSAPIVLRRITLYEVAHYVSQNAVITQQY